jgi:hypothetical protein
MENCIICGGEIVRVCKCMRGDTECANGHSYHYSPYHKEFHEGMSDHRTNTDGPDCCIDKKVIKIKKLEEIKMNNVIKVDEKLVESLKNMFELPLTGTISDIFKKVNFDKVMDVISACYSNEDYNEMIYKAYYESLLSIKPELLNSDLRLIIKEEKCYDSKVNFDNNENNDYVIFAEDVNEINYNNINPKKIILDYEPIPKLLSLKVDNNLKLSEEEIVAHVLIYLFNLPTQTQKEELYDHLEDNLSEIDDDTIICDKLTDVLREVVDFIDTLDTDEITFSIKFKKLDCEPSKNSNDRLKKYLKNTSIELDVEGYEYNIPLYAIKNEKLRDAMFDSIEATYESANAYYQAVDIIHENKIKEYCNGRILKKLNFDKEEDYLDFKKLYPEISEKLLKESIQEAKFVCPISTQFKE